MATNSKVRFINQKIKISGSHTRIVASLPKSLNALEPLSYCKKKQIKNIGDKKSRVSGNSVSSNIVQRFSLNVQRTFRSILTSNQKNQIKRLQRAVLWKTSATEIFYFKLDFCKFSSHQYMLYNGKSTTKI